MVYTQQFCRGIYVATVCWHWHYLSVSRQVSVRYSANPNFYRGFLTFLITWVLLMALGGGLIHETEVYIACSPDIRSTIAVVVPNIFLLTIQLVLLALTMKRIAEIVTLVRSDKAGKRDKRLMLVILRFVPTIFAQFLAVTPTYAQQFYNIAKASQISLAEVVALDEANVICGALAAIIDSVVLIATNKALWKRLGVYEQSLDESRGSTSAAGKDSRGSLRLAVAPTEPPPISPRGGIPSSPSPTETTPVETPTPSLLKVHFSPLATLFSPRSLGDVV